MLLAHPHLAGRAATQAVVHQHEPAAHGKPATHAELGARPNVRSRLGARRALVDREGGYPANRSLVEREQRA